MSEQDSFIAEVTEEVRRDRLFAMMRRYGWIAVVLVVLLVGGAAWNEWRKAQARDIAQTRGDAIIEILALEDAADRAARLVELEGEGDAMAALTLLRAAELAETDPAAALRELDALSANPGAGQIYRDLATLKSTLLPGGVLEAQARADRLVPLTIPGAPFRPLATEQLALAYVELGNTDAALKLLTDLVADGETTQGLRRRASQLIVALGGTLGSAS